MANMESGEDPIPADALETSADRPVAAQVWTPQGHRALILGLGLSGLAAARWLNDRAERVWVADNRPNPPGLERMAQIAPQARYFQKFDLSLLDETTILVVSPGLSPVAGPVAEFLNAAQERGIEVLGEIELFARALKELEQSEGYRPKLIAITGTNGKTTTTQMTSEILRYAGLDAVAAGNVGDCALDVLADRLGVRSEGQSGLPQAWVLELSSFQLATTSTLAPDAAAILNVSEDHLDWHGSFEHYSQSKGRIFRSARLKVFNREDPVVVSLLRASDDEERQVLVKLAGPRLSKAKAQLIEKSSRSISFGLDAPKEPGDFGIVSNGMSWLAYWKPSEEGPLQSRRKSGSMDACVGSLERLMPADALRVRGRHNWANALAALALAQGVDAPLAPLLHSLRLYRGEPHRCEWIATINGIDYIEDSKGTNVGATIAALLGLERPIVLIAGGDGKGQDFGPLGLSVSRYARAVVLIGRDAQRIADALSTVSAERGIPIEMASDLPDAVMRARRLAESLALPGGAVLLSPACASLDMFNDYKHRAEVFQSVVRRMAEDIGHVMGVS